MKAGDHPCLPFPKKVERESLDDETDLAVNKRHRGSESRIRENKWKANKVTCQHGLCCRGAPKKYSAITVRICIGKCRRIKTHPGTLKALGQRLSRKTKTLPRKQHCRIRDRNEICDLCAMHISR